MTALFSVISLAIIGFLNAYFLHWQYRRFVKTSQRMYCLIGEDCTKVVSSDYGATWGVKNELLGMGYYAILSVSALVFYFVPRARILSGLYIFLIALVAAGFSFYLLYAQTRLLRSLCSWCLIAITINIIIFISSFTLLVELWNWVS